MYNYHGIKYVRVNASHPDIAKLWKSKLLGFGKSKVNIIELLQ